MKIHDIKILPDYFEAVLKGKKNFEIRKNDRDYKPGDVLMLREWDNEYTGRVIEKSVAWVMYNDKDMLKEGYIAMQLEDV